MWLGLVIAHGGCGRHFWQVTTAEYVDLLKWALPVNIFYMLSADIAQLSLLVLYLNLSPDRTYRIVLQVLIAAFAVYAIIYAGVSIFGYQPFHAHWDLEAMSTARRNATGVICIAAYCCYLKIQLFNSSEYTHGLSNELSWMHGELAGCVICASASTTRAFFARYVPRFLGSLGSTLHPCKVDAYTTGLELEADWRKQAKVQLDRHGAIRLESDNADRSVVRF
ncbi:hypothetical protein PpBr36_04821 [Pyricularia pennisetigena]|uniref:hypothetical protein n=1 Tax=Pyricularia pennisetigena TaxID=1578925 RepID=UPI00114E2256|nr:hypothetical protein PpBr36_04821 [Pyricularia pennisetigena]TLS26764.1 hypothetical protein PpBr36_04821 [Pyricularia pennisetigena]